MYREQKKKNSRLTKKQYEKEIVIQTQNSLDQINSNHGNKRIIHKEEHRQPKYPKKQKEDSFNPDKLRDLAKKGGTINYYQQTQTIKPNPKTIRTTNNQAKPIISKINQPQNQEIKKDLDSQLIQYQEKKKCSQKQKDQRGHILDNKNQQSEDLSFEMEPSRYNPRQFTDRRKDSMNRMFSKNKQKKNQQQSDWLNQKQDDKNVSINQNQNILKDLDCQTSSINTTNDNHKKKQSQSKNHGVGESNYGGKQQQISNIDASISIDKKEYTEDILKMMTNEQSFAQDDSIQEKKQEQLLLSVDELKNRMQSIQNESWLKVSLTFESYDNIHQLKIKQIQIVKLESTVYLSSDGITSIIKYQQITHEEIKKIISFKTTGHSFPRILANLPEDSPSIVEGDQSIQQPKPSSSVDLELCRVKGAEPQSEKAKVNKNVVVLRSVQVSCMECSTLNKIAIVQSSNTVMGSCKKCSTKMYGKITALNCISE